MSGLEDPRDDGSRRSGTKSAWIPATAIGWCALGSSAVGLAAWIVLPMITAAFADKYPITNTGVMPAIGAVLVGVAAVLDVLCIWRWKERSVLNVVAAVLILPLALFLGFYVVGGALGGSDPGEIPDVEPDMTYAKVESSSRDGQALVLSLRVDTEGARKIERPLEGGKYPAASIRIDPSTKIRRQTILGLKNGDADDVLKSKHVDVWFSGAVAESDPVQATAGVILLLAE